MKKRIISLSFFSLSLFAEILPILDLSQSYLQEILLGKHPQVIVAIEKETVLPLKFFTENHLILDTEEDALLQITLKEPLYIRFLQDEKGPLISNNLLEWTPLSKFVANNYFNSYFENGKSLLNKKLNKIKKRIPELYYRCTKLQEKINN